MQVKRMKLAVQREEEKTLYRILLIISFAHLLNDTVQSLVPAMFPILRSSIGLSYTEIGIIAFALNLTASIIQPIVGSYTDKHPLPYALPIGLIFTLIGIFGLAFSSSFVLLVLSVSLIGFGSATFHPESSRVAYMAAGKRRGFAQSIYQVGGNTGQALAPAITALILVPYGQKGAVWFTLITAFAIVLLFYIARWYKEQITIRNRNKREAGTQRNNHLYRKKVMFAIVVLIFFVFARTWFHSGITNFYTFYAIEKYGATIQEAQVYLFIFLFAGALGTFLGGPIADRFGKKLVIASSMLLAFPLTLLLPFVGKWLAYPLITMIGFIALSSFSVSVVYAQQLMPGKIGMVSGLVIGLGFGMGAIGSIVFGSIADYIGITKTMYIIAALPIIGIVTLLLPSDRWIERHIR